jgi:hypothetical protein
MSRRSSIPRTAAILAAALVTTEARADRQATTLGRLSPATAAAYDAYCNDGSLPSYALRLSRSNDPVKRQSWVIFMKGGGLCDTEGRCIERWSDIPNPQTQGNDGIEDHEIGNRSVMTSVNRAGQVNASKDFDGGGILDFDGLGPTSQQPIEQSNPFEGYNRLYLHYCSSDGWRGTGAEHTVRLTPEQIAYNQLNGPLDPDYVEPPMLPGRTGNILFAGANIAEAFFSLLVQSGRVEGGHIVLAGSSGGGLGVASNLDRLADILRDHNSTATLFGVIDSATAVVTEDATRPGFDPQDAFWSGNTASGVVYRPAIHEWDLLGDQDCALKVATSLDPFYATNPYYCASGANLLRTEVETPFFFATNSYDPVVHPGAHAYALVQIALEASGGTCDATIAHLVGLYEGGTLTDVDLLGGLGPAGIAGYPGCGFTMMEVDAMRFDVIPWLRAAVTRSATFVGEATRLGGDPANPRQIGYYVPNYEGVHQLLAEGTDQRMFHSDAVSAAYPRLLDPQLGVSTAIVLGNGDGGTTDTRTLSLALRHYQDAMNGAAPLLPDAVDAPYRVLNDFWSP